MTSLTRVALHLHVCPVAGTRLGLELRTKLRSIGYTTSAVNAIAEFIGQRGTATDSPVDAEDVETLNAIIRKHTGAIEADPTAWVAAWDEMTWGPTDEPFEPSAEDREWAEVNLNDAPVMPALCGGAPAEVPSWTINPEGRYWIVRRDGRPVYASEIEASARAEMARRSNGEWVHRGVDPLSLLDPDRITDLDHAAVTGCV